MINLRSLSFEMIVEVGRRAWDGAKSVVSQGRLFARPNGAIILKIPQAPAGLIGRKKTFR